MANQDRDLSRVAAKETTTQKASDAGPAWRTKPGVKPPRTRAAGKPSLR